MLLKRLDEQIFVNGDKEMIQGWIVTKLNKVSN